MAFNRNDGGFQRKTHKAGDEDGCTGNWTCAQCGMKIDELPFPPDPNRLNQLLCRDCHRAKKQSFGR